MTQLDVLPQNITGLPFTFKYHPFRFVNFKEQARIRKQAAQRSAVRMQDRRQRFYMDFGFMRASTSDYSRRDKTKDWVVFSYDGFSSNLLIIDKASRYVWVFLTASKSPPSTSSKNFFNITDTKMAGASERIKAANWLGARISRICYCVTITTLSSQLVLIVLPKTVRWRYIMTILPFAHAPSSKVLVSPQNFGPWRSYTLSTSTSGWSIAKPKSLLSNAILA